MELFVEYALTAIFSCKGIHRQCTLH